jgi:hypothetical protein
MKPQAPASAQPVPIEYAGKWIAWDHESTQILGSGRTLSEAAEAAKARGEKDPVLEKVPRAVPVLPLFSRFFHNL